MTYNLSVNTYTTLYLKKHYNTDHIYSAICNSGVGSFLVRWGLTGSIESQVAGGLGGAHLQTLKLFQLLCGSKSTFRCNLKY